MPIAATNPIATPVPAQVTAAGRPIAAAGFSSLLDAASDSRRTAGLSREQQMRQAVEQLTASAFILPLLGELRDQPLDSDLFGGGFAEDSFAQQLDTVLADRMVAGGNLPIVEVIYNRLSGVYREHENSARQQRMLDMAA